MEIWKDVVGYEGRYMVSNEGRVASLLTDRVLKTGTCGSGYQFVILRKDGKSYNRMVHRLVMAAFNPTDADNVEVNHIDGDKTNNALTNLEWVTRSENLKHAVQIGLVRNQCRITRSVTVTHVDGMQKMFPTMCECAAFFGFTKCWLGNYVRKHGNPCRYGEFEIHVSERGTA